MASLKSYLQAARIIILSDFIQQAIFGFEKTIRPAKSSNTRTSAGVRRAEPKYCDMADQTTYPCPHPHPHPHIRKLSAHLETVPISGVCASRIWKCHQVQDQSRIILRRLSIKKQTVLKLSDILGSLFALLICCRSNVILVITIEERYVKLSVRTDTYEFVEHLLAFENLFTQASRHPQLYKVPTAISEAFGRSEGLGANTSFLPGVRSEASEAAGETFTANKVESDECIRLNIGCAQPIGAVSLDKQQGRVIDTQAALWSKLQQLIIATSQCPSTMSTCLQIYHLLVIHNESPLQKSISYADERDTCDLRVGVGVGVGVVQCPVVGDILKAMPIIVNCKPERCSCPSRVSARTNPAGGHGHISSGHARTAFLPDYHPVQRQNKTIYIE
ncbi:hypothetical protein CROQUDRAFT_98962 [Cronartium quercuum f. sp. fusiforme G11]|uniref:Uncharacterized protein n=1 Tax=Cronartium quercuum f. sp. fusiforme G11 TaxID=708437 RepID=A0A9P6N7W5_9BASI|nr:hypothetical protein CROQUDRAFT_98962 [Cronartium quercuum f. sp. fusiforme G11]